LYKEKIVIDAIVNPLIQGQFRQASNLTT